MLQSYQPESHATSFYRIENVEAAQLEPNGASQLLHAMYVAPHGKKILGMVGLTYVDARVAAGLRSPIVEQKVTVPLVFSGDPMQRIIHITDSNFALTSAEAKVLGAFSEKYDMQCEISPTVIDVEPGSRPVEVYPGVPHLQLILGATRSIIREKIIGHN